MIDYDGLQKHRQKMKQDILDLLKTEQRVACVQPTGIGKSHCIAQLCNELKGKKLVLEPGTAVIDYMQEFSIDTPDTTYITYHSLLRPSIEDLAKYFKEYDYIFLDEMHRALAEKWGKQLEKVFTVLDNIKANYKILGFSATPIRSDNRDVVEEIFKGVQTEPYYLQDAILDGILPNIEYHSSIYEITDKDRNKIKLKDTPLAQQILRYNIDEGVSEIFKENLDLSQSHKIIVFVDKISNIEEAIFNVKKWLNINFSVYKVHSKIAEEKNLKTINDFQNDRNLAIMFAVNILNEGVHLNKVDTVIFLRKTSSSVLYNQQLGRIVADTIENPKVFDLVNNIDNLENGYSIIFKERANQLGIKTDKLVTKNEEHLKITTHQEDLINKLKSIRERTTWTKEEDEFLKDNYETMSDEDIGKIICKSAKSIESRRARLHLLRVLPAIWTDEEIQCLKDNYYKMNNKDLAILLDKKPYQVKIKKEELELNVKNYISTRSNERINFIQNNSKSMTDEEISEVLKISVNTVRHYRKKIGIVRIQRGKKSRKWTEEEDEFIKRNCKIMTDKEMGEVLDRSKFAVKSRRTSLGEFFHRMERWEEYIWCEEDKNYLKNNYGVKNTHEIANYLNKSVEAIHSMAHKMNLHFDRISKWNPEEITVLINEYKKLKSSIITQDTLYILSAKLNNKHTFNSIRSKISYLKRQNII